MKRGKKGRTRKLINKKAKRLSIHLNDPIKRFAFGMYLASYSAKRFSEVLDSYPSGGMYIGEPLTVDLQGNPTWVKRTDEG